MSQALNSKTFHLWISRELASISFYCTSFIDSANLNKTFFSLSQSIRYRRLHLIVKLMFRKILEVKSQKQICWTFSLFASFFLLSLLKFMYSKEEVVEVEVWEEKTLFAVVGNFVVLAISGEIERVAQKEITKICKVREESNKFIIFFSFHLRSIYWHCDGFLDSSSSPLNACCSVNNKFLSITRQQTFLSCSSS